VFVEVGEPWRTKAGIFVVCSSCLDANLRWFLDLKFMWVILFKERNLYPGTGITALLADWYTRTSTSQHRPLVEREHSTAGFKMREALMPAWGVSPCLSLVRTRANNLG
jgi:hypothetical protein